MKKRNATLHKYLVAALACTVVEAAASASADPMAAPQKSTATSAPGVKEKAPADPMAESQRTQAKLRSGRSAATPTGPIMGTTVASAPTDQSAPAVTGSGMAKSGPSHLMCTFRISKSGKTTLLRSVEVEGEPVLPEFSAGSLVYEVSNGAELVSTEGVIDPFEMRATPGPEGSENHGHHFESNEEAEVVVKIPRTKLADANLDRMSVNFYQYDGGDHEEKLDASLLRRLKANYKLRRLGEVPARVLAGEIRKKAIDPAR
mgnify:CR=1 FL=1